MKPYTTLLLDADDTIFDFAEAEHKAFFQTMAEAGLPATEELYARYTVINERHWKALERGEITREQVLHGRYACFLLETGLVGDPHSLNALYLSNLSRCAILFDDSTEALRLLRQGRRLYIVTNGNVMVQKGRFSASPIMEYIEDYFISGEIGYEKPDIRYFQAVFAKIPAFDPETTLLVGDSATSDLQGALNAGLDSCYVNRRGNPLPDHIRPVCQVPDLMSLAQLLRKED